jgi:flagellar biosynthesis protein FlhG
MPEPGGLRPVEVIGVASGKGGVGKTTVSTNLAMALAQSGRQVMLLDADLGLANAQLALGVRAEFNLSHVTAGQKRLSEIMLSVRPGLQLIPGASGVRNMAALGIDQTEALIQSFEQLDTAPDVLVVDVAAGISPGVLCFMGACTRRVVVVKDDPSSIADAYGIIKVMHQDQGLSEIHLVCNQVHSEAHGQQLHLRLADVCRRFLGLELVYLGSVEADELVLESHRRYLPVVEFAPASAAARDYRRLAHAIHEWGPPAAGSGHRFFSPRTAGSPRAAAAAPLGS